MPALRAFPIPGAILSFNACVRKAGYRVIPIPGANAAVCALSAAGITNPHFLFYGFLPTKTGLRQRELTASPVSDEYIDIL
jgi:16S rRNA (cytidine1402-2'-O)-methyltransferase